MFIATLTGLEGTLSQMVHARRFYEHSDVRWGHRFVDIVSRTSDDRLQVDLTHFHETIADPTE